MKVVIAGKNAISVNAAKHLINLIGKDKIIIIPNNTDNGLDGWQPSLLKFAKSHNLTIHNDLEKIFLIQDLIFISLEYDKIIRPKKFKSEQLFNIHFSLLPKYKGVYTSAWPILNGEKYSGVTLHKIERGIDTGDIISQLKFPLERDETARSLYEKYNNYAFDLFKNNIEILLNASYHSSKQLAYKSSYYSKTSIDYRNLRIDLNKTAFEIDCQVRAFSFREYQLPIVHGKRIYKVSFLNTKSNNKPGKVLREDAEKIIISTVDYDCELYIDYFTEIISCCRENQLERLREIIRFLPNIHEKTARGWSPVIVAAYYNNLEIVRFLYEKGADINDTNYNGTTVLMYAKDGAVNFPEKGTDLLKFLIKLEVDINQKDFSGKSIYDYIDKTNNSAIIKILQDE